VLCSKVEADELELAGVEFKQTRWRLVYSVEIFHKFS